MSRRVPRCCAGTPVAQWQRTCISGALRSRNAAYILPGLLVLACLLLVNVFLIPLLLPASSSSLPGKQSSSNVHIVDFVPAETRRYIATHGATDAFRVTEWPPTRQVQRVPYTIVTQVYGRHQLWQLRDFAARYAGEAAREVGCVGLVFVWNNLQVPPPTGADFGAAVPVRVIRMHRNSMNNRFLVGRHIDTDAVVLVDDDLRIAQADLTFAVQAWGKHQRQIVGFLPRAHIVHENKGATSATYSFFPLPSGHYSMVLVGASVFHRDLMEAYAANTQLQAYVDEVFNCDDIGLNMLASSLSGLPPVHVQGEVVSVMDVTRHGGLSEQGGWMNMRDKCLSELPARAFDNTLPLRWSDVSLSPAKQEYTVLRVDSHDAPVTGEQGVTKTMQTFFSGGAEYGESGAQASLVVTAWGRPENLVKILCEAHAKYPFLDEFVIVKNNPSLELAKELHSSTCVGQIQSSIVILNQETNIFTQAKYVGCQAAHNDLCFIIDDDFLPSNLNSLHALAAANPHLITVGTDASSWVLSRKWSFLDIAADLHTGFTWLGTGAFVPRHLALKFLELQEALAFTDEQKRFADLYFSLLLNELPTVVQQSLHQEGLNISGAFSCSTCTDNRAKNSQHQGRALGMVKKCLGSPDCPIQRGFFSRSNLEPVHKAISHGDDSVFLSTIDPVSDNWCRTCPHDVAFAKGWAPEHGSFHFIRAVDGDASTKWDSHRRMKSSDWFGLDFMRLQLVEAVTLQWSGCDEPTSLRLLSADTLSSWAPLDFDVDPANPSTLRLADGPRAIRYLKVRCYGGTRGPISIAEIGFVPFVPERRADKENTLVVSSFAGPSDQDPMTQIATQLAWSNSVTLVFLESGEHARASKASQGLDDDSIRTLTLKEMKKVLPHPPSTNPPIPQAADAVVVAEWLAQQHFGVVHFDVQASAMIHAVRRRRLGLAHTDTVFVCHVLTPQELRMEETAGVLSDYPSLVRGTMEHVAMTNADIAVFSNAKLLDSTVSKHNWKGAPAVLLAYPPPPHNLISVSAQPAGTDAHHFFFIESMSTELLALQELARMFKQLGGGQPVTLWANMASAQSRGRLQKLVEGEGGRAGHGASPGTALQLGSATLHIVEPRPIARGAALLIMPSSRSEHALVQEALAAEVSILAPDWYESSDPPRPGTCAEFFPLASGVVGLVDAIAAFVRTGCAPEQRASALHDGRAGQQRTTLAQLQRIVSSQRHASLRRAPASRVLQPQRGKAQPPNPLVSVILPAFNRGPELLEAVDSILASTYPRVEVVIVDDGSDPEFMQYLKEAEAKLGSADKGTVHYRSHSGPSEVRNFGARHASGEFLLFFDSDDILHADAIENMLSVMLTQQADTVMSWLDTFGIGDGGSKVPKGMYAPLGPWYPLTIFSNTFGGGSAMHRKAAFLSVGGYSPVLPGVAHQDYNLLAKLQASGKHMVMMPIPTYSYRRKSSGSVFNSAMSTALNRRHSLAPYTDGVSWPQHLLAEYAFGRTDLQISGVHGLPPPLHG